MIRSFDILRGCRMHSWFVAGACAMVVACAHVSDVEEAHAHGDAVTRSYASTEDQAWRASLAVMHWAGADSVDEHRPEHYMIGSVDALGWPTLLGAWITPGEGGQTSVSVVSKRKIKTMALTAMREETFQRDFAKALAMIQSGQPLPDKEP